MSRQYPEQISNPTIESPLRQWREYGGLHRMEGSRCKKCGKVFYPHRFVCNSCHSLDMETYRFSGRGRIINYTVNIYPSILEMGFKEHAGKIMCLVKLDEGPVVLGELIETESVSENLKNARVSAVLRKLPRSANTTWKYGYKFVLEK